MATRVTFVSGTAEVKMRDKKDEGSEGGIDSVPAAQPVNYVDGKCTCCPYGYHIDLDFLDFCKNVADGSTLSNLKRIQRTKRKLRKSMEVMLNQKHHQHGDSATATLSLAPTPPPDVVHSTEASRLINMVQYEQSATHQVLRDIDSSVNATLASIDTMQRGAGLRSHSQRYMSSDSEDGYSYSPVSPISASSAPPSLQQQPSRFSSFPSPPPAPPPRHSSLHHHSHHHHSNGEESSHLATSLSTSGRTDSLSSLSSVSTVSSEQVLGGQYTSHASGMLSTQPHEMATAQMRRPDPRHNATTTATAMTSERLAATMATHFPPGERDGRESPSSPMSPTTTISKASLAAIRESMAISLQRMRDLEDQVKAIPILQVRISVLKEEKRLLALQLRAKSSSTSVRSVGVGEDSVDSPDSATAPRVFYPTASSPFSPLASSPLSPTVKSPPATLPKPSRTRTMGIGEHNVVEPYLLQPDLPTGFTITDNQVQTEIRSSIHEKETVFVDRGSAERHLGSTDLTPNNSVHLLSSEDVMESRSQAPVQTHFTINQIQRTAPRPMTRSIGIGEGNVHDSSLQIHEKELRTVILGGSSSTVGKRNVGVEVRVPTRSVGVSYSCDDIRPPTRTVGVNVTFDTSSILTSLDFKGEAELRAALRGVLQRNVRSIGTNCNFRPPVMETGVQHEAFNVVSVGSGGKDCRVDVEVRQSVAQRTLGTMAKPETANRMASTDKDWVLDQGTNTMTVDTYNKACSTEIKRMGTSATNTEFILRRGIASQTELHVFQDMDLIKSTGSNTTPITTTNSSSNTVAPLTSHRGVNTKAPELIVENFDVQISFDDKAVNTPKELRDTGVNTSSSAKEMQLSMSRVECVDVAGEAVSPSDMVQPAAPRRPLTMQEQIIQRGASQATAFLGSTSSCDSLSPTSPLGQPSLLENGSATKTVIEKVYSSPSSSRQVWSSQLGRSSGIGSAAQSEIVSSSSRGEKLFSSDGGQQLTSDDASSGDGGVLSQSTITKTITTSGGGGCVGGGFSSGGGWQQMSSDLDSTDGGGFSRSTVTKTVITGGGSYGSGGGGSRETKVTKTVTTSGSAGCGDFSRSEVTSAPARGPSHQMAVDEGYSHSKGSAVRGAPQGGSSYMERFGYSSKVTDLSSIGESVSSQNSESSSLAEAGEESSGASVEVREGVASLLPSMSEPSLQSGQVLLVGGGSREQNSSQNFSSFSSSSSSSVSPSATGSLQDMSTGKQGLVSESAVVKRLSSGGRLSKHRHSDGGRISLDAQGVFSGRRVGSVEDFMPDDMRRLMNIEMMGSGSKSSQTSSGSGGKLERMITKTTRTVTTKRTSSGGNSTVVVTKTVTNPDGSVTTTSSGDLEMEETIPQGKGLGILSTGQLDLSKIASDDTPDTEDLQGSVEESENGGIKDSGYYDASTMVSTVSESSSFPTGLDMSSMGSLERRQLKSIMKKSKSDSANPKRGISFADTVTGGTGSSSEEGASESDEDSTTSFEEGSYDGREGDITYQCRDDEAIAQGLPGAKMYDQNIRETYELSDEMRQSCDVLASYLVDSTTIQTKELNANLAVVQEEWFRVSSHKLSSAHQVEDYLSSINEISHRLLEYIVNLVDSNGNAAIHYCVSHCNFDIVGLLLDTEVCDIKRPNKAGYTPTMLASLAYVQNEDHRDIIRRLFAAGDINACAEQTGQTALMLATSQCREDMVQLLLEQGANCNQQDFDGSTALMCACEHGHTAIVQLLLAQPDCDATLTDNENSTALSIAMEAGHKDIGVILYKHLNFSKPVSPGIQKKRKGSSSPTPRHLVH